MPKINVYLPDELAAAVRDAQLPVSSICQAALERAVRDVSSLRGADQPPTDDQAALGIFGRFTPRAREALAIAERTARERPHNYVGTEHMLLGILDEQQNLGVKVLQALDIEPADLRVEVVAALGPATQPVAEGAVPFTALAKSALEQTGKEAFGLGHNYIGCEHLLLGVLAVEDGVGSQVLRRMGVELRTTRRAVVSALSGFVHAQQAAASRPPEAKADGLDEILARLDAIERRLPD
jgi:ATP-dependent Clp protease ATP-binding subunit ClpC